jgi:NADH:ubiquinone oxidoreductase subunit 5 (chain L)/Multisubunit Na+/H+ antiporter, MnhA subunit
MLVILLVLLCISFLSPLIVKFLKGATHLFISFSLLVIFIIFISDFGFLPPEGYKESYDFISELSLGFSFYIDGLGYLFSLILLGIGILVMYYSGEYIKQKVNLGKYYLFMMLFLTSMFGLVISGNLITTFIFWEFTSISSFFLIGINNEKPESRAAAYKALFVTAAGGLALLAGFILIYTITGTFSIPEYFQNAKM